jgi:iron complex outermembrane receptor protein
MKARGNSEIFALSLLAVAVSQAVYAADEATLDEVVVTAPKMQEPLKVETNPKAPRQPVPAHDGADYLKSIPGFAVTRKGGTDGDPMLRGMAGSRMSILVDGQNILGGCNGRMDAPTAYIFPEVFDSLTVLKGPQSVVNGPGNSAGVVMFEHKPAAFSVTGNKVHASLLAGSFGRHDEVVDAQFGSGIVYGKLAATNSQSGDYKDGAGKAVHSAYQRYSGNAAIGWTPDADTRVELSGVASDGHAAYADRGMDGTKFLRQGAALKFERRNLSPLVEKLEAQVAANNVDHVMDDQTLRRPIPMMSMGYANLKRNNVDGRVASILRVSDMTRLTLGADAQSNSHSSRSAGPNGVYNQFSDDAKFDQQGVFGELKSQLDDQQRVIAGYRADFWKAQDQRPAMIRNWNTMMGMVANPSAGQQRSATLHSGFARYENQLSEPTTVYAGIGHVERFPDYWELIAKQGVMSGSAFDTRPEKTNQLDVGMLYKAGGTDFSASAFYNKVTDYILIDYSSMMKMSTGATRNINATTYGAELGFAQALADNWKLNSSLAYVQGSNDTDGKALAQLPPLEARLSVGYDDKTWSFSALTRVVAAQNRYDLNRGTIVGRDIGPAGGFGIFSLNAGWRASKTALITAGVDNVFNKLYAESISRAGGNGMGGAIAGYTQTTRVNEPGRTLWLKGSLDL